MNANFLAMIGSGGDWSHWISKFWSKVDRQSDPSGCWPWIAGLNEDGYGKFAISLPGKDAQIHFTAHRFSLFLATGIFDELTEHDCHNPPCVRPDHIHWGNQSSNIVSTVIRRTHRMVSFTEEDVRSIRRRFAAGERIIDISRACGRDFGTIASIVHRRSWAHIHPTQAEIPRGVRRFGRWWKTKAFGEVA